MDQINQYLTFLASRGRRESTIITYGNYLRRLIGILEDEGLPTDCEHIGVDEIALLKLRISDLKEGTQLRYLFILGQMVEHYTGVNPYKRADFCWNRDEPRRVFITLDDFRVLYLNARPMARLILVLGAYMGLRRTEICGLRDGDLDKGKLTVRGKGHGPQGLVTVMDVPEPVLNEIESFRAHVRASGLPRVDDHLVQGHSAGVWKGICAGTVNETISTLGEFCGIEITPHSLRRLYATTLYNEAGADLNTLRILMRHSEVETTLRCYVNADPRRITEANARATAVLSAVLGC